MSALSLEGLRASAKGLLGARHWSATHPKPRLSGDGLWGWKFSVCVCVGGGKCHEEKRGCPTPRNNCPTLFQRENRDAVWPMALRKGLLQEQQSHSVGRGPDPLALDCEIIRQWHPGLSN